MPLGSLLHLTRLGGKAVPLLVSASAHAAVAVAAMQMVIDRGGSWAPPPPAVLEIAAPEIKTWDSPANPAPLALQARADAKEPDAPHHMHPYPVSRDHDAVPHDPNLDHRPAAMDTAADSAAQSEIVADHAAPTAHFVLAAGATTPPALHGGTSIGYGSAATTASNDEPASESAVDTPASKIGGELPAYPREAQALGIEAELPLEIVVDARGEVVDAHAVEHAGYGLDEAAVRAVRSYRFAPARRAGKATAVRMRWVMRFQLR